MRSDNKLICLFQVHSHMAHIEWTLNCCCHKTYQVSDQLTYKKKLLLELEQIYLLQIEIEIRFTFSCILHIFLRIIIQNNNILSLIASAYKKQNTTHFVSNFRQCNVYKKDL